MSGDNVQDLIIVGSGPAGYTAAIYAARANLRPILFTSSVEIGGELMKTTEVENFPGFPEGIQGPDLMVNLQAQAEKFGTELIYEDVVSISKSNGNFRVITSEGTSYLSRAVIISTGAQYRSLGLPRESELSGHGVSWCATCDGFFFKDKYVAVVGGGDSALEEANFLTKFASKVFLIHRKDTFKASKAMQDRTFANPKIEIISNAMVTELVGEEKLEAVFLSNGDILAVDGLFIAIGSDPRTDLVKDLVELTPEGFIQVDGRSSKTSVTGIFAAGDVIDPKYRQAITAAASGCVAALDVEEYLG